MQQTRVVVDSKESNGIEKPREERTGERELGWGAKQHEGCERVWYAVLGITESGAV